MGALKGTYVPPDNNAPRPCVGSGDVCGETDQSPDDASIDVNARTCLAYENARALNPSLCAVPSWAPLRTPDTMRHKVLSVRNPYPSSQSRPSQRQTTIPKTLGCNRQSVPNPIDTKNGARGNDRASGGRCPSLGGSIISPQHRDWDMRARSLGASRFDVIRLACLEYHIGMDGVTTLTEDILEAHQFSQVTANVKDVVVCYSDIILAHRKVTKLWYNTYAHTYGPQVDKIIQKSLSVFP